MKRSSKILALLLALALICGAFAVVASADGAAVTGVTTVRSTNFESLASNWGADAVSSSSNPASSSTSAEKFVFQQGGRTGKVSVGSSAPWDDNQYVVISQGYKKGTSTPYMYASNHGTSASVADTSSATSKLTLSNKDFSKLSFYSFDIDVMSPTDKFIKGANIEFSARYINSKGSTKDGVTTYGGDSFFYGSYSGFLRFGNDANGNYIYLNGKESDKLYVDASVWTHFTIIVEIASFEIGNIEIHTHLYVNNEYFGTVSAEDYPITTADFYNNTLNARMKEFRLNYTTSTDTTQTLAIDNISIRSYDKEYNGNLGALVAEKASLDTWESGLYDADSAPFGILAATIGEGNAIQGFDSLAKAVAAAKEGDTVKVVRSATAPVTVDKEITIDATYEGGVYDVNLVAADGYGRVENTEGVHKFVSGQGLYVTIEFDSCFCEEYEPENAELHPFYTIVDEVTLGANILESYTGPDYEDWSTTDSEGYVTTVKGWNYVDYDGNVIAPVGADDVVTEAMLEEGWVSIVPDYEKMIPTYQLLKGSTVIKTYGENATLADVATDAMDASLADDKALYTVKLLKDVTVENYISIANNKWNSVKVKIELNGKTVTCLSDCLFYVVGWGQFTITSSVPGAKIIMPQKGVDAADTNTNPYTGVIKAGGNKAKYQFIGQVNGVTTLSVYADVLFSTPGNAQSMLQIDGGEYYRLNYLAKGGFISGNRIWQGSYIKNATFIDRADGIINLVGSLKTYNDATDITIDNCTFVTGNLVPGSFDTMSITVKNSKIIGNIAPTVTSSSTKLGVVTLGAGNYISGTTTANVVLAEGMQMYKAASKVTLSILEDESVANKEYYTKYFVTTAGLTPVTITWQDAEGNVLATTTEHVKGMVPNYNYITGEVVEGWLVKGMNDWADVAALGDETEKVIKLKDTAVETIISAVSLKFNIGLSTHLTSNVYIPKTAEGLTITSGLMYKNNILRSGGIAGTYEMDGIKYSKTTAWPGASDSYSHGFFTMTFTYEGVTYCTSAFVNPVTYCEYLLNEANGYNDAAKTLAANALNYITAVAEYLNKDCQYFKPTLEANAKYVTEIDATGFEVADMSAISKYISGVSLNISNYGPAFRFVKTEAGKAEGVKITISGIGYDDKDNYVQTKNNVSMANVYADHVITVVDGENTYTATFNLGNYIAMCEAAGQTAEVELLKTVYAYAKADADYWFNPAYKPKA